VASALWRLEAAGELDRTEVAAALGLDVAEADVRMRAQRDLSRGASAAPVLVPVPAALVAAVLAKGSPARRLQAGAAPTTGFLADVARPLSGAAPTSEPSGAAAHTAGLPAGAARAAGPSVAAGWGFAGWLVRAVRAVGAHPVAAAVSVGALAVGVAVSAAGWSTPPADHAAAGAPQRLTGPFGPPPPPPSDATRKIRPGPISLESADAAGRFVIVAGDRAALAPIGPASDATARRSATLTVVTGLADPACFSFRGPDGRYLRHASSRLRLSADEKTVPFRGDATFCARPGAFPGSVSLESSSSRGDFLRHVGPDLWVDTSDGSRSFLVRHPPG
jgi:hypothetical protein